MTDFRVTGDDAGCRLDRFVRKRLALKSLGEIYHLIRTGGVRVNGKKRRVSYRLHEGDMLGLSVMPGEIRGTAPPERAVAALASTRFFERNFRLLYEDDSLLVCDKPPGLVVHPGTGHSSHDTLVDLAASHVSRASGTRAPCRVLLAHRLDKDTSGVIVLAKDRQTVRALNEGLRTRSVRKEYIALCHGIPAARAATIELDLVRSFQRNNGTKMRVNDGGRASRSSYRVVGSRGSVSRIVLDLHTGRTHQLRVHLAHISHPIIGDVRYGDRSRDQVLFSRRSAGPPRRLYLHACRICFVHPRLGRELAFEAPLPTAFEQLWRAIG